MRWDALDALVSKLRRLEHENKRLKASVPEATHRLAYHDNAKFGCIEGGRFESVTYGDGRNAVIVEIKMPDGFKISPRHLIFLEIDEWKAIKAALLKEDLESDRLRRALHRALLSIRSHRADTIWRSSSQTLADYIEAVLAGEEA
jgi:hypothetical protein